jgi:subtilisin family serine protease
MDEGLSLRPGVPVLFVGLSLVVVTALLACCPGLASARPLLSSSVGPSLDWTADDSRGSDPNVVNRGLPPGEGRYIVVLKDSTKHPGAVAQDQAGKVDADVNAVYRLGVKGYAAVLGGGDVKRLEADSRVTEVVPDQEVELFAQTVPTGLKRIGGLTNTTVDVDEKDDARVNVDVAVIDSGIDYEHPDLNVAGRTNCGSGTECIDNTGADQVGHGTHVSGIVGALDNSYGVVGTAPGARLWAVKVDQNGALLLSSVLLGIEWVTAHAGTIEVANMSLGCWCGPTPVWEEAIEASVEAGVVYVVAAGNESIISSAIQPARYPAVIDVSAISDYDGSPGGEAESLSVFDCEAPEPRQDFNFGDDDNGARYSNWGEAVDIAAPGNCILSTWAGKSYALASGTSMASPYVAGAAALLASESNPQDGEDVQAIRQQLLAGNFDWNDDSEDDIQEPLLDIGAPTASAYTHEASHLQVDGATLSGGVNPAGAKTTYQFEYGTSASYGSTVPAAPKSIGSGNDHVRISEELTDLEPGTIYHYRLVAVREGAGTIAGEDRTFRTKASPPGLLDEFKSSGVLTGMESDPEGNLLVSTTSSVKEYDGNGDFVRQIGSSGEEPGQYSGVEDVAVDSEGNVYVADAGNAEVDKFSPNGEFAGSNSVGAIGLAVDGEDALYALTAECTIFELDFSSEPRQAEMGCSEGPLTEPFDLAIDSQSNFYIANRFTVEKYSPEGELVDQLTGGVRPRSFYVAPWICDVAVDSTDNVYVSLTWGNNASEYDKRIVRYDSSGEVIGELVVLPLASQLEQPGIRVDAAPEGKVWVGVVAGGEIRKWDWTEGPKASTKAPSAVKKTEATLNASINPHGAATTYYFEYGTGASYGSKIPLSPASAGAGTTATTASQTPTGLSEGTTYHYRVVAINAVGTTYGTDKTFTTLKAPEAKTEPATAVGPTGATLNAKVNPNGSATAYQFEYGKTTSYGSNVPIMAASVGSGTSDVKVGEPISGLSAGTTYHYRVVATNSSGTAYGVDEVLTTSGLNPELWYSVNYEEWSEEKEEFGKEEPLPGAGNPSLASGSGEIEIRTMYSEGIRINCDVSSVEGELWNANEASIASGKLTEVQFSNCYFRNTSYPESWNCEGTVTGTTPWAIEALGAGELRLKDVDLSLDGTECLWWSGGPQPLEGTLTGDWDNEQQEISWSSADGVQGPGNLPPSPYAVWRINGSIGLDIPSEYEGPNLVLK